MAAKSALFLLFFFTSFYLYQNRPLNLNFDSQETKQMEALRSEQRSPSPRGKSDQTSSLKTGFLAAIEMLPITNDLVYGEGSSDITSQIDEYQNITSNKPIRGSIFVTHDAKNTVDVNSFRLGSSPLKVKFLQSTQMSSTSNIVVSIYAFQLDGLPIGAHTLPSIHVKVASKEIQALPLYIEVPQ